MTKADRKGFEPVGDVGARFVKAIDERNRAFVAANTAAALQYLAPDIPFSLRSNDDGEWMIVRGDEVSGWPLGAIPHREMDAAMACAGPSPR